MDPKITVTTFRELREPTKAFYELCGRKTDPADDDTLIVATEEDVIIGVVRLCFEEGHYVLRTMQIHPEKQRTGLGSLLLKHFERVLRERRIQTVHCMPYEHLDSFYGQIGFVRIPTSSSPQFLQDRLQTYLATKPQKLAMLMIRENLPS